MGLKLHEDWGTTPASINNCLNVAEQFDIQVAIHTDTLNESGFVEDTLALLLVARYTPITPRVRAVVTRPTLSRLAPTLMYCRLRRIRLGPTR